MIETIERNGIRYAEIIRASMKVEKTTFFSPPESSFQFGLLSHEAGFFEPAHTHREFPHEISDTQQMFVVQRGVIAVQFYEKSDMFFEVVLAAGDAITLIHGVHSLRVIEDMQCISIKQGPFKGVEYDKVAV